MAKVDLKLVENILRRHELDVRQVAQILNELNEEIVVADAEIEERPKPPKKQYVIMLSDPHGELDGKNFTGWVLQIPEEESPYTAQEKLFRAAYEFNATPKGRRIPVKTIGEACECMSSRVTKEEMVWIKTKEPVLVVTTNNKIPMETKETKL